MEKKRTVVITGGGKGIGTAISEKFYAEGYYVVIGSRGDSGISEKLGNRAKFFQMDVRNVKQINKLVDNAVAWTGQIDVMINNAGYSKWRSVETVNEEFWNRMIDTNLKGTFFGCQAAAKYLQSGGSIINISSLAGKRGSAKNSVYCASKFGVNGITQALSKELGPKGIRVNAICPVYVKTKGLMHALQENDAPPCGETNVESYLQKFSESDSAMAKLPSKNDIADVCFFLASSSASAITGQCLNVDCGVMPQ